MKQTASMSRLDAVGPFGFYPSPNCQDCHGLQCRSTDGDARTESREQCLRLPVPWKVTVVDIHVSKELNQNLRLLSALAILHSPSCNLAGNGSSNSGAGPVVGHANGISMVKNWKKYRAEPKPSKVGHHL